MIRNGKRFFDTGKSHAPIANRKSAQDYVPRKGAMSTGISILNFAQAAQCHPDRIGQVQCRAPGGLEYLLPAAKPIRND
jgi:hypothetical protein